MTSRADRDAKTAKELFLEQVAVFLYNLTAIDDNELSKKLSVKCSFQFHHTETDKTLPLINVVKTQHVTRHAKTDWKAKRAG